MIDAAAKAATPSSVTEAVLNIAPARLASQAEPVALPSLSYCGVHFHAKIHRMCSCNALFAT